MQTLHIPKLSSTAVLRLLCDYGVFGDVDGDRVELPGEYAGITGDEFNAKYPWFKAASGDDFAEDERVLGQLILGALR